VGRSIQPVMIEPVATVEELRRATGLAFNRLVQQINAALAPAKDRLTVADPVGKFDAVNLHTMRAELAKLSVKTSEVTNQQIVSSGETNSYLAADGGSHSLTTSYADVSGLTLELDATGDWLVLASVPMTYAVGDGALSAQLVVNGVAATGTIDLVGGDVVAATLSRGWVIAGGSGETVKIQAKKAFGTSTSSIAAGGALIAVFLKA
jgi:hypothetical protein